MYDSIKGVAEEWRRPPTFGGKGDARKYRRKFPQLLTGTVVDQITKDGTGNL